MAKLTSWPLLLETEGARPAEGDRPSASAVWRVNYSPEPPTLDGIKTVLELFECVQMGCCHESIVF